MQVFFLHAKKFVTFFSGITLTVWGKQGQLKVFNVAMTADVITDIIVHH